MINMCDDKIKEFANFLIKRGDKAHADTWATFSEPSHMCQVGWERAKAEENLMGEIMREYEKYFGKEVLKRGE